MRRPVWIVAACLTQLLFVISALAQSPPPDAMTAAQELLATMRTADQMKAILPGIVQALKPAIVQNRPEVERDFDTVMPLLLEGMSARVNEVVEMTAVIYARNFTADELRETTAFYRTPTGEKFLQKLPTITQQSMAVGQRWGQSVGSEMQGRIVDELRKRGHKI